MTSAAPALALATLLTLCSTTNCLAQSPDKSPAQAPAPAQPSARSADAAPTAPALSTIQATVSYQFDRTGVSVPHYTIKIRENGTGTYQADPVASAGYGAVVDVSAGKHIERQIIISPATVTKIFQAAREADRFNLDCASKLKNIADTGKKTLTYEGADGKGSCTYNYSEIKAIQTLTDLFIAIAFTLDEGRRLEFLHRYDRLGLDSEMTNLSDEAKEGRALEFGLIEPTLDSIANDTAVIQRVRVKAAKLIEQAKAN
jgi:hypothetical protein